MQTFGKTMRSCLPAIGLGLISAVGLASVTAITAPAAMAQKVSAKKEFVENFTAANTALQSRRYADALKAADAAQPHADGKPEKVALEQIRVSSYVGLKNHQEAIKAIEKAQGLGLPGGLQKNYADMLAGEYAAVGNTAKALALTKAFIAQYGGDSTKMAYVAKSELSAKNYNEAIAWAQKAIDQNAKEGKKANGVHYNILLNAYSTTNKLEKYYDTLERVAPLLNKEDYWRPLIERAKKEPKFKSDAALLDVYRALDAAGVKFNTKEQREMGDLALNRGMAIEAEKIWAPLFKSGEVGGAKDKDAERNKKLYQRAQDDAKADKASDLAASEAAAAAKPTGEAYASTGEAWIGAGDYAKAIDLFQKGLTKGQMEPGIADLARLRLGIAQFKAGKKEDARKTWQSIKADNGAAWLAKSWIAISKKG